ncbi:hypothetical protein WJX72_001841 [[Myrmecia] bisecta]|uniref:HNH nuclease domain-containing protein n=1 Tax=[Myrmecia] bisecta TaxID=41462 RepID=A0AAW1R5G7_9CHLO
MNATSAAEVEDKAGSAITGKATYWFHDKEQATRPFPLEFQDSKFPVTPAYDFISISAAVDNSDGMFRYGARKLTEDQANELRMSWQIRYPCIPQANSKGNMRELPNQRANATGKMQNRLLAWDALGQLEATALIPPAWQKRFRSDPYGNVVSIDAKGVSVCAFELDHIFPWSRGGLSVPANFMAVYYGANRHVKRDKIANGLTDSEMGAMQCGLSVERFLHVLSRRDAVARTKVKQFDQLLETLLLTPYAQPWRLAGMLDDDNVLRFLNDSHQASLVDLTG